MLLFLIFFPFFCCSFYFPRQFEASGRVWQSRVHIHLCVLSAEGEQEQHRVVMRGSTRDPGEPGTAHVAHAGWEGVVTDKAFVRVALRR